MKKIFAAVVVGGGALALTFCSGNDPDNEAEVEQPVSTNIHAIAIGNNGMLDLPNSLPPANSSEDGYPLNWSDDGSVIPDTSEPENCDISDDLYGQFEKLSHLLNELNGYGVDNYQTSLSDFIASRPEPDPPPIFEHGMEGSEPHNTKYANQLFNVLRYLLAYQHITISEIPANLQISDNEINSFYNLDICISENDVGKLEEFFEKRLQEKEILQAFENADLLSFILNSEENGLSNLWSLPISEFSMDELISLQEQLLAAYQDDNVDGKALSTIAHFAEHVNQKLYQAILLSVLEEHPEALNLLIEAGDQYATTGEEKNYHNGENYLNR